MHKFKQNWEISKNWQLLYPFFGILGLIYSAYKFSILIFKENYFLIISGALILFFILLKITLFIFKKLEKRWIVKEKWQIIRIFIIFAITGPVCLYVIVNPILSFLGLTKESFSDSSINLTLYRVIKFIAILPLYQILLLFFGWLFGEHKFFLLFIKKMLNHFQFKKSINK